MNFEERRRGLLRLIEDYRDKECLRILEAARAEAVQTLKESYGKNRNHLHRRIASERSRAQARIQAARAEQATKKRWAEERRDFDLLQSAWPHVRKRLLTQWQLPDCRQQWVETYLRRALSVLPQGHWMVRYAPDWTDDERQVILAKLPEILDRNPRFASDPNLEAGIIVASSGAELDASLAGLLLDRDRLEARLLALIAAQTAA